MSERRKKNNTREKQKTSAIGNEGLFSTFMPRKAHMQVTVCDTWQLYTFPCASYFQRISTLDINACLEHCYLFPFVLEHPPWESKL